MKVVLLGEASVGKTTLLYRYIDGVFQESASTIGASFSLKQWGCYNVAIWDTAGEERFSGLGSFYCRGASAAVLTYDITRRESFEALRERFLPLLDAADLNHCLKIIVGNKLDLVDARNREVTKAAAEKLARAVNAKLPTKTLPCFETSCRTGEGVTQMFHYIFNVLLPLNAPRLLMNARNEELRGTLDLHRDDSRSRTKCC